jgi:hypothetical protein
MISNWGAAIDRAITYIKTRLDERSTWAAVGIGVTGAAALSPPWSYVLVAVAVIGTLTPSPGGSNDA